MVRRFWIVAALVALLVGCDSLSPTDPAPENWILQALVLVDDVPVNGWTVTVRDQNDNVFIGATEDGLAPGRDQVWTVYDYPTRALIKVEGSFDFEAHVIPTVRWNPILQRDVSTYVVLGSRP